MHVGIGRDSGWGDCEELDDGSVHNVQGPLEIDFSAIAAFEKWLRVR